MGSIVVATIAAVRRNKIKNRMSPGHPLSRLWINAGPYKQAIQLGLEDIKGTCRADEVIVTEDLNEGFRVDEYPEIVFKFEARKG